MKAFGSWQSGLPQRWMIAAMLIHPGRPRCLIKSEARLILFSPPSPEDADSLWRLAPDAGLRMHCWDDECVIWHGAAGDTHRMPQAIGQLLDRLRVAPANAAALSLAIDLHQEDVEQSLSELARLGIVEPAL